MIDDVKAVQLHNRSICAWALEAQDYATFVASFNAALNQQSLAQILDPNSTSKGMAISTCFGRRYATSTHRRLNNILWNTRCRIFEQLRQLKASDRYLKCSQLGHWRAECPKRDVSITDAMNERIDSFETHNVAIQGTLFALLFDEYDHNQYLHYVDGTCDSSTEQPQDDDHICLEPKPYDKLLSVLKIQEDLGKSQHSDVPANTSLVLTQSRPPPHIITRKQLYKNMAPHHAKTTPIATKATYFPGDMVYVYWEKLRKHNGPHMIASIYVKLIRLHICERTGPENSICHDCDRLPYPKPSTLLNMNRVTRPRCCTQK